MRFPVRAGICLLAASLVALAALFYRWQTLLAPVTKLEIAASAAAPVTPVAPGGTGAALALSPSPPRPAVQNVAPHVRLRRELLDRFIVVPEYKMLFCFVDKVACQHFSILFRNLRRRFDPRMETNYPWELNTPAKHNWTKQMLESALTNASWHKAVFYREPLERLVSAYRSKCEHRDRDGPWHCQNIFGSGVTFSEVLASVARWRDLSRLNAHWRPMHRFCGGLAESFQYYNTVRPLTPDSSHRDVTEMLRSVGIDPQSVPNFAKLFPPNIAGEFLARRHNTDAASHLLEYYGTVPSDLLLKVVEFYRRDYELFNISLPPWAAERLAVRERRRGLL